MMDISNTLIKVFSTNTRTIFLIDVGALVLLFLPREILDAVNIPNFRPWLLITVCLTSVLLLGGLVYDAGGKAYKSWLKRRQEKHHRAEQEKELRLRESKLHNLSIDARKKLQPFIESKITTVALYEDTVTIYLEEEDILYQIPRYLTGAPNRLHPRKRTYHLSRWAYHYLLKNPHLLSTIASTYFANHEN
ncbi:MAG: superinfection exclusion B family protein [Anaerolineae bacterium]|nr:superinfection exclusion B family protein [Anaerolineae bacterium]